MEFAADTGKVRRVIGQINELEGLRGEHTLLLDPAGKMRVTRSIPIFAKMRERLINETKVMPDTTLMPTMSNNQFASLKVSRVLYCLSNGIKGFGLTMANGESTHAGTECNRQVELPRTLKRIQTAFTANEEFVHSIRFEGDSVLEIG